MNSYDLHASSLAAVGESTQPPCHQCPQCSKSYQRSEHLVRHMKSHSGERPYQCESCGTRFQRSDVLKRHSQTCTGSKPRSASITKRACDQCSKSKRACNLAQPCSACFKRSTTCTFSHLTSVHSLESFAPADVSTTLTDFGFLGDSTIDNEDSLYGQFLDSFNGYAYSDLMNAEFDTMFSHDFSWRTTTTSEPPESVPLRFLESFTQDQGFVSSFECGSEAQRFAVYHSIQTKLNYSQLDELPTLTDDNVGTMNADHFNVSYAASRLASKSKEIVSIAREIVEVKPRNSAISVSWPAIESLCAEFFNPRRLQLYLELYWALWHPNVNFMHRPTFDAANAKAVLVAAMAIIGASVSPRKQDNDDAKCLFNVIEEGLFTDDDFCFDSEAEKGPSKFPSEGRLQAIQAAYMVCLYQNWEGSNSGKRRIRRFRFSTLVAVVRDIGIRYAQHPAYHPNTVFSWTEFVLREQLIRTFLWVFLLDTAFVIFNNAPPRMAIREMKMHFASSEDCFNAWTSEECFRCLANCRANHRQTFSELSHRMSKGVMSLAEQTALAFLGPLNLFGLISALHSMIFQIQQLFGFEVQVTPIQNLLANWRMAWLTCSEDKNETISEGSQLDPRRIGFYRHCSEYWLLAKLITDRICASSLLATAKLPFKADAAACNDDCEDEQLEEAVLDDYDQTSMAQVNALISQFQNVGI